MPDRRGAERRDLQGTVADMVHDELDSYITLNGSTIRHYKHPPEDADFPYLTTVTTFLTHEQAQTSDAFGGAQDVTIQLSGWSVQRNSTEIGQLLDKLATAVRDIDWAPPGNLIFSRVRANPTDRILSDPNPQVTFQGIKEFDFRLQLPPL